MAESYTVVLTKGAHTVSAVDAAAIERAILAGDKLVNVGVELFPGAEQVHPATLVVAHVVALAVVEETLPGKSLTPPGVTALWGRR